MEFVDHTGHLFTIQTYNDYPIGYEYETHPYVFWVDDAYASALSVDCYYVKPIRFVLDSSYSVKSIGVSVNSEVFRLLPGKLSDMLSIDTDTEIDIDTLTSTLTLDDLQAVPGLHADGSDDTFTLYTFYVVCSAPEEGSYMTNVLISVESSIFDSEYTRKEFTFITVGGVFTDECEGLIINGHNMGIDLPKDILKAIYQCSYYNDAPNESIYAAKIKEYLLNFMNIRGECGNYQSAIDSLKWFGYGDHMTITKLLKTDNEFIDQFVHDYFNTDVDILDSYKHFRHSMYVSLFLDANRDSGKTVPMDFSQEFFGESWPIYEDLFSKTVVKHYDEGDIDFIAPYYNFVFDELFLKIAALKYYYKKYFLPIHLSIHSGSIREHVTMDDMKIIQNAEPKITDAPVLIGDDLEVRFPIDEGYYVYDRRIVTDDLFNHFSDYDECLAEKRAEEFILINNIAVRVPIEFSSTDPDKVYDCVLIFSRDGKQLFESHFSFCQTEEHIYDSFIIHPPYFNPKYDTNWWVGSSFTIDLMCNDKWYKHSFTVKVPEFSLKMGKLQYKYSDKHSQIKAIMDDHIDFNAFMYIPSVALANDINFMPNLRYGIEFLDYRKESAFEQAVTLSLYYNYGIPAFSVRQYRDIDGAKVYVAVTPTIQPIDDFMAEYVTEEPTLELMSSIEGWTYDEGRGEFIYGVDLEDYNEEKVVPLQIKMIRHCKEGITLDGLSEIEYVYTLLPTMVETTNDVCTCICEFGKFHGCKYKETFISQSGADKEAVLNQTPIDPSVSKLPIHPDREEVYSIVAKEQITEMVNKYRDNVNIPKADKYLNRICVYYMKDDDGKNIKYSDSASQIPMYRSIFNDDGTVKDEFTDALYTADARPYDIYVMHDDRYWYMVLMSKATVDSADLSALDSIEPSFEYGGISFVFDRKDNVFLINRMQFTDSAGYNHFQKDDIIIASIDNINMPCSLTLGSKWEITPASIMLNDTRHTISSKGNTAVISIEDKSKTEHVPGYYNIDVRYSVDGYVQHQQRRGGRFLIEA